MQSNVQPATTPAVLSSATPTTMHGEGRVTQVKICGLTRASDAAHAERHGADYLGVILASGPRLLSVAAARDVLGVRRAGVRRVGVFGARRVSEIVSIAEAIDLDVLQLHGDPTVDEILAIRERTKRSVWPVVRVEGTQLPESAIALAETAGALVLDAKVIGQLGGTGVALDWAGLTSQVAALRHSLPSLQLILAGGLRSENVTDAIALLEPEVVDVSSGVELSPGVKDPMAVERFVSAVRAAKGRSA